MPDTITVTIPRPQMIHIRGHGTSLTFDFPTHELAQQAYDETLMTLAVTYDPIPGPSHAYHWLGAEADGK